MGRCGGFKPKCISGFLNCSPRPSIHPYGRGHFIWSPRRLRLSGRGKGEAGAQARYGWTRGVAWAPLLAAYCAKLLGRWRSAFWGEIVPQIVDRVPPPPPLPTPPGAMYGYRGPRPPYGPPPALRHGPIFGAIAAADR
jgi:hypothetical protein